LDIYGLNRKFIGELYVRAKANSTEQVLVYISSELMAMGLVDSIRLAVHKYFLNESKDGTENIVYSMIQLFLQGNLLLLE
jgi:hypothetical protein